MIRRSEWPGFGFGSDLAAGDLVYLPALGLDLAADAHREPKREGRRHSVNEFRRSGALDPVEGLAGALEFRGETHNNGGLWVRMNRLERKELPMDEEQREAPEDEQQPEETLKDLELPEEVEDEVVGGLKRGIDTN